MGLPERVVPPRYVAGLLGKARSGFVRLARMKVSVRANMIEYRTDTNEVPAKLIPYCSARAMKSALHERFQTVIRTGEFSAFHKEALRIPRESSRGRAPKGSCRLAAQYLLEESRLKRREVTIIIDPSAASPRMIDVECAVPDMGWGMRTWYLPLAFFPKLAVAPNLEVVDESGKVIPVPTKDQNFDLTSRAIDELIQCEKLDKPPTDALLELAHEVVTAVPHQARVCRLLFEQLVANSGELVRLLRLLEDKFVLWVPVEGFPSKQHHFRIERQEIHPPDPMLAQRPVQVERTYETAAGSCLVQLYSAEGRAEIRWRAVLDRMTQAFAIKPIEATVQELEACRATSSHLRIIAPKGFVVRNIRLGAADVSSPGRHGAVGEIDPLEDDVVVQGWDRPLGHVHLSKPRNPDQVLCKVTLGPKEGIITLWTLATLLSAALIWIVHHHTRYGSLLGLRGALGPQIEWAAAGFGRGVASRVSSEGENKQIAAAVLLVGPAFVSAWSLRAEGGDLMRSFLSGARILLLLSAAFSIAAALSLAGILPTAVNEYKALEIYAAGAYLVAVPMAAAYLLGTRPVWIVFRRVLNREGRNFFVILVAALALLGLGLGELPPRVTGMLVVALALGLACIAANSAGEPLRQDPGGRFFRPLAAGGALPMVLCAGSLLGFYADVLSFSFARAGCVGTGSVIAVLALYGWVRV